jgi:hypothetical protein
MRTPERTPSRSVWHDADGHRTAHLAGHLVQLRQVDECTLDVCIDGYSRRWSARGKRPLREAERAIVAMLLKLQHD